MTSPAPVVDEKALLSLCDESVAALERALRLRPEEVGKQVDVAERVVVRLRDNLIARMRQDDDSSGQRERWRTALDHVNAALSLIVGVEYPSGGIQTGLLEQACDTLKVSLSDA